MVELGWAEQPSARQFLSAYSEVEETKYLMECLDIIVEPMSFAA